MTPNEKLLELAERIEDEANQIALLISGEQDSVHNSRADLIEMLRIASASVRSFAVEREEVGRILDYVLALRMYGEGGGENWRMADVLVEGWLRRDESESPLHASTVEAVVTGANDTPK